MKNLMFFLTIGVSYLCNSQEWVSLDGPNGRPEAKIVQGLNGKIILQTSCAIYSSENNGQNYYPVLQGNSNSAYAIFMDKMFFLAPSSISSLQNTGSGWVEETSSVYFTTDLFADDVSLYRAYGQGVERTYNGVAWVEINNGLPQHYEYTPTGPTTVDSFLVYEAFSVCSNNNYLFAATDSAIYRTDKTNISWIPMNIGLPMERFDLVRCQGDTVFAVNDEDVYFSYDAGSSWSLSISFPNGSDVRRVRFIQDTVFLATSTNGIQWSSNFGLSWMDGNSGLTSLDVWDINLIDNEYYMAGAHGSSKGFPNWVSSDYGAVCAYTCDLAQSQNGIVASNNPDLYYLGDDSTGWVNTTKNIPHWTSRTVEYANNKVVICMDPDANYDSLIRIMESNDNGLNWTTISTLGTEWLYDLESNGQLISANKGNDIIISTNEAVNWSPVLNLPPSGIACTNQSAVFFQQNAWFVLGCDGFGQISKSTDMGLTWQFADTGIDWGRLIRMWEFNSRLFVSTLNGMYYSDNNGDNWHYCGYGIPEPWQTNISPVYGMVEWQNKLFASNGSKVYVSFDNGINFTKISQGLPDGFNSGFWWGESLLERNDTLYFSTSFYGVYSIDLQSINPILSTTTLSNQEVALKLFPNPTTNKIQIVGLDQLTDVKEMYILDYSGKTVLRLPSDTETADLSVLNSGLYFLHIESTEGIIRLKFIKL